MTEPDSPTKNHVLVLDGGIGSELRRRGVRFSERCWSAEASLSHRQLLTEIHTDYIRAGADIVTANTFAASRFVLAGAGLESRFDEINRSAIDAARKAADSVARNIVVAASLSCYPPAEGGVYPNPALEYECYSDSCAIFVGNSVDLILVEMMQDTLHARLACRAASESSLPFWIGFSCRIDPRSGELVGFDHPEVSLLALLDALLPFDPDGIAIMHTPLDAIEPALREMARHWSGPFGVYPEIPYPEDPASRLGPNVSPREYANHAALWLEMGASTIGGCCGTTPDHIKALRALLED